MSKNTVKLAGIAHSKLRNAIGLVGIEVHPVEQSIHVKLAKHWDRKDINKVAPEASELFNKLEWSNTIIDVLVGEHVIQGLRRGGLPLRVISVKKKVLDVSEIRRVKTMDMTEMTQFMLQTKLAHKLKFPKHPTPEMQELESQVALFAEKTTEIGGVNYFAPGDELDNLTKALIISSFAARPFIQDSVKIIAGPVHRKQKIQKYSDVADVFSKLEKDVTNRGFRRKL